MKGYTKYFECGQEGLRPYLVLWLEDATGEFSWYFSYDEDHYGWGGKVYKS